MLEKIKNLPEKDRIILRNVMGAFSVKGMALVVSLLTMPVYMRFFPDRQTLGVWYTILSVLTWILNFDLGIGNGLRNHLARAISGHDDFEARKLISSAYWLLGILAAAIALVSMVTVRQIDWNAVFNIDSSVIGGQSLLFVVRCALAGILLQFFLRLVSSVLYALQRSAVNNLIALITSVLLLLFALAAPRGSREDSLKMFSAAHIFCTNVPLLAATVWVFRSALPHCRPGIKYCGKKEAGDVLSLGGMFFLCQILYMCIASTNEFLIARYFDPSAVVDYQIYNKLFTLGSTVFMLALTPVWSAVSRATAQNDYSWLRKLYRRLSRLSLLVVAAELILVILLQPIVNLWLGRGVFQVDRVDAVIFALFGSAMVFQSVGSTFANGMGRLKIQAICYGAGFVLKFSLVHFGAEIFGKWSIVVLANFLILLPCCIGQHLDISRVLNRK